MPLVMSNEEMEYFIKHKPDSSEYSLTQIAKSMKNIEKLLEAVVDVLQKLPDKRPEEE